MALRISLIILVLCASGLAGVMVANAVIMSGRQDTSVLPSTTDLRSRGRG